MVATKGGIRDSIVDSATPCTTRRKPSGGRGSQRKKIELPLPDGSQASRKLSLKSLGIASRNKVIRIRTPNTDDVADACKAGASQRPSLQLDRSSLGLAQRDESSQAPPSIRQD